MKNERIVDSWNRIKPDSAADERMLSAILARNQAGQSEKEKVYPMNRTINWKRLTPIAACFMVVVAIMGIIGNNAGWFGGKILIVDVDGGTLSFHKGGNGVGEASYVWDVDWGDHIERSLTADESRILFGEPDVTGHVVFRSNDNALMHFEGKLGEAAVILSANGHALTDNGISGTDNEEVSEINGIPVTAGYFVTDANSRGIKNIIYFATFEAQGTAVYVELGGAESESDALRTEIGGIVDRFTKNPPNSAAVTAE